MALQVGALNATLVHAHLDDHHNGHHDAPAVHAHFSGHPAGHHDIAQSGADGSTVIVDHESEQTTRLQIFIAVEAAALTTPALPPARFTLASAPQSLMRQRPDVVRSHGPPPSRVSTPRAPPTPSVDLTA
jgi:hypothetical protein